MAGPRRLNRLVSDLTGASDIPPGDLVVALSGGADSGGLAALLALQGRRQRAVHVDHGTPQARALRAAAVRVADVLAIDLQVVEVEPLVPFSEERARDRRYSALDQARSPGEWVLTAHTLEDQAETVLLNIVRGTGITGLGGMRPRSRGWLARPLLRVRRGDLRELAMLAGVPFTDDPSNADVAFSRNAMRQAVLPLIERFNPSAVEALARTAEHAGAQGDFVERAAQAIPFITGPGTTRIPVGALLAVDRVVGVESVREAVRRLRPPHPPTAAEVNRVWTVVDGSAAGAELEGGVRVSREAGMVLITAQVQPPSETAEARLRPGVHRVGGLVFEVAQHEMPCQVAPIGTWAAVFPSETQLVARVAHDGPTVRADGVIAWIPGEKRLPVAFCQPGQTGYLSVLAKEDSEWT